MIENFNRINEYWFGNIDERSEPLSNKKTIWFFKSDETDKYISDNFKNLIDEYKFLNTNNINSNIEYMSLIILFDQFTRNIFRNKKEAFEYDNISLILAKKAVDIGIDKNFHHIKRVFIYLPFEHSESLEDQKISVELFTELENTADKYLKDEMKVYKDFAIKHYEIIERFGRFPHRNNILGRISTIEEENFLKLPNSSF